VQINLGSLEIHQCDYLEVHCSYSATLAVPVGVEIYFASK
jgi:hypothetical protein